MQEYLEKIREKIIKSSSCLSNTMLYRMSYDIDNFNSLVEDLGYNDLRIDGPKIKKRSLYIGNKSMLYLDIFEVIADTIIDMYKDMDYLLLRKKAIAN